MVEKLSEIDKSLKLAGILSRREKLPQYPSFFDLSYPMSTYIPSTVAREKTKKVGFWCTGSDRTLPDPAKFIDKNWGGEEKEIVLKHLTNRRFDRIAYKGWSDCRICKCQNGSEDVSDGYYIWPSGLAHYLSVHFVKPPQDFIDHCTAWSKEHG